jgi:hypothetical protein
MGEVGAARAEWGCEGRRLAQPSVSKNDGIVSQEGFLPEPQGSADRGASFQKAVTACECNFAVLLLRQNKLNHLLFWTPPKSVPLPLCHLERMKLLAKRRDCPSYTDASAPVPQRGGGDGETL